MSVYIPGHDPALWWERLLGHPGLVIIAWWAVLVSVQITLDPLVPGGGHHV